MARYLDVLAQAGGKNGESLVGATLGFFEAGTTTPLDTFQDEDLTIANTNPVVADGEGRFPDIFLQAKKYFVEFRDSAGVLEDSADDVAGIVVGGASTLVNIAAMTALLKSTLLDGTVVEVDGYFTQGDGGGGRFFFDASSTDTANGGTIIITDEGGAGRWKRIIDDILTVTMFGAKKTPNDDTAVFQAAIDFVGSTFSSGSGGGGFVHFPSGAYVYTGVILPKGVSLSGDGRDRSILKLKGLTATGIKCLAADTQSSADQVSFGVFKDLHFETNESAPTSQVLWNITGFSRWTTERCFFTWHGGLTAVELIGATPAGSGGPAHFYNGFYDCFFLRAAVFPAGGIAMNVGDTSTTKEQITTLTMVGGRFSGANPASGTGLALRGTGNRFFGVTFEGIQTAVDLGSASTRGADSTSFFGCYWEGNTTNRNIRANALRTTLVGNFLTGGVDVIADGTLTAKIESEGYDFQDKVDGTGTTTKEIFDYYKEGIWVPVASDAVSGGNLSPTVFSGTWTRDGRTIHLTARLVNIDTTGMTGGNVLFIQNVPFAAAAVFENTGTVLANNVTLAGSSIYPNIGPSGTTIRFFENISAAGVGSILVSDITSGVSDLQVSITYNV